jgi:NAD-dependent DNA ligase
MMSLVWTGWVRRALRRLSGSWISSVTFVATSTAKQVIKAGHQTLDAILALTTSQYEAIPKFGAIRAKSFHDGLKENKGRIKAILNAGVTIKSRGSGKLNGMTFCFSGSFEGVKKPELMQMVEKNGGEAKKNFSSDLTYLVTESKTTNKAKAAATKGIAILSQQEFMDLLK